MQDAFQQRISQYDETIKELESENKMLRVNIQSTSDELAKYQTKFNSITGLEQTIEQRETEMYNLVTIL